VQGVFLRLWERNRDFATIGNLKSYLYRAVGNACLDYHRRRQSRHMVPLVHAAAHTAEESVDHIDHIDSLDHPDRFGSDEAVREYERINTLLAILPREQAEVVRMRTTDDLSFVEIAEILQIPSATAKSRFRYGIDKLRDEIKSRN
jgi:RNA polymerase sigma-70 factor (ECF subfamily)